MASVSYKNVMKSYGDNVVIKDLNIEIADKEFVVFVGPSGCGKSTLLNILGLLDNPSSGEYHFIGNEVSKFSERQRAGMRKGNIGFVFQHWVHSSYCIPLTA